LQLSEALLPDILLEVSLVSVKEKNIGYKMEKSLIVTLNNSINSLDIRRRKEEGKGVVLTQALRCCREAL